jgi:hypothetical protein
MRNFTQNRVAHKNMRSKEPEIVMERETIVIEGGRGLYSYTFRFVETPQEQEPDCDTG